MKSQRTDACGGDRWNIFPGGAFGVFGATRLQWRVFSGAIFAKNRIAFGVNAPLVLKEHQNQHGSTPNILH